MLDDSAEELVASSASRCNTEAARLRWSRFETWQRPMSGDRALLVATGRAHGYDGSLMGEGERVYEPVGIHAPHWLSDGRRVSELTYWHGVNCFSGYVAGSSVEDISLFAYHCISVLRGWTVGQIRKVQRLFRARRAYRYDNCMLSTGLFLARRILSDQRCTSAVSLHYPVPENVLVQENSCGDVLFEIPKTEVPLVAEVHMKKYRALEFTCDGTTREHGYLAVGEGEKVWILSSIYAGHASNIFPAYVFCARGRTPEHPRGWIPCHALSWGRLHADTVEQLSADRNAVADKEIVRSSHCGDVLLEIPQAELPLVAEVHMEEYCALEFTCDGNTREAGYIAVGEREKVWMLSSIYAGHAGNMFSAYVYCACGRNPEDRGWIPTDALSWGPAVMIPTDALSWGPGWIPTGYHHDTVDQLSADSNCEELYSQDEDDFVADEDASEIPAARHRVVVLVLVSEKMCDYFCVWKSRFRMHGPRIGHHTTRIHKHHRRGGSSSGRFQRSHENSVNKWCGFIVADLVKSFRGLKIGEWHFQDTPDIVLGGSPVLRGKLHRLLGEQAASLTVFTLHGLSVNHSRADNLARLSQAGFFNAVPAG